MVRVRDGGGWGVGVVGGTYRWRGEWEILQSE